MRWEVMLCLGFLVGLCAGPLFLYYMAWRDER